MLVAWLPVEICPVHSEANPASCDPWAALLLIPSRTMTLFCRLVVHVTPPTVPPLVNGESVLRKMKLVVCVGGLPVTGGRKSLRLLSVAPHSGRTQPQGENTKIK